MKKTAKSRAVASARRVVSHGAAALFTAISMGVRADVDLSGQIVSNASGPRYSILWDAIGGASYGVQSSSNLVESAPWRTLDVSTPPKASVGLVRWMAPEALTKSHYYRLTVPQPEISSIEPAVFPPGTNIDIYVLGHLFTTGDVIRVDGVPLGAPTFIDHTTLQVLLTSQSPGTHTIEVVRAGGVLSSFVVTCADETTAPELVLQEPPALPPAAPLTTKKGYDYWMAQSQLSTASASKRGYDHYKARGDTMGSYASKKGYDYWQAQSQLSSAGLNTNPYFTENQNAGHMVRVAPSSGQTEVYCQDLVTSGRGLDFVWARTYLSRTGPTNSAMGTRWTHSYDVRCETNSAGVVVFDGAGRKDTYRLQADGTYAMPGCFREGVFTNGAFRLVFADTSHWEFNPLDGTPSAGKLGAVRDRHGNVILCGYDGSGRLRHVVDDLGRTNTLAYDISGRLQSLTDCFGRIMTYSYYRGLPGESGAAGDLATVTTPAVTGTPNTNDFPSGKTTTYTYENGFGNDLDDHLLLSITDPSGQTAAEFVYQHNQADVDFLRCVSVQRGIDKKDIRREVLVPSPTNRFATSRVFYNDYAGNLTECFYDSRNRCVMTREFTGRVTSGVPVSAVSNRPTGKLRSTDPDYYETKWDWNNDSLCTRWVMPGDNVEILVYESDFNKQASPLKRGDLRVVRAVSTNVQSDLVTSYQYDPRFGSDPSVSRASRSSIRFGCIYWASPSMRSSGSGPESTLQSFGRLSDMEPDVYLPIKRGRRSCPVVGGYEPLNFQSLEKSGLSHLHKEGVIHRDIAARSLAAGGGDGAPGFVTAMTDPDGYTGTAAYDDEGNLVRCSPPFVVGNDPPQVSFGYDGFGRLVSVTNAPDANGRRRVDKFGWSLGHLQDTITDFGAGGSNITTTFERDARGNVTRCIDPRGNDGLFTYNALDQCVRCETPTNVSARCATDFFYDANDNLVTVTEEVRDETDTLTGTRSDHFSYDVRGRLTLVEQQVDGPDFASTGYSYDGNDNLVLVQGGDAVAGTDPFNAVSYEYDERDLLFREIRAPGSSIAATNEVSYSANGGAVTKKYMDDSVAAIDCAYDEFDRLTTITDPTGNVYTYVRSPRGRVLVAITDGEANDVPGGTNNIRLAECHYDYDAAGRCVGMRESHFIVATQTPVGNGVRKTGMSYAPNGDLTSITDNQGHVTTYAYDNAGRCVSVTDPANNVVAYTYDACGNVTTESRQDHSDLGGPAQVFTITNTYDALNRCVRSSDNLGNNENWSFGSQGRVLKHVDPLGTATFYSCDLLGRRTLAIGDLDRDGLPDLALDASSRATWSTSNPARLLSTSDSHSNTTGYAYDSLGRCTNIVHPDGTERKLVWSPRSNLVRQQDPRGNDVLLIYDQNDRCISKTITPGPGVATNTTFETFEYDGLSRLTGAHDNDCNNAFAYDSLGNCVSETLNGLTTTSTYDSRGLRASLTYPGGRHLTYARSPLGRCTSIADFGLSRALFEYDGPDRLARVTYLNNIRTRIQYDGDAAATNAAGDFGWMQVRHIRHAIAGGFPIIGEYAFAWDRRGNKTSREEVLSQPAIPRTNSFAFSYDAISRLTNSTLVGNGTPVRIVTYELDRAGNWTNVAGSACPGPYQLDATAPAPQDFQMNQFTHTPCDDRQYDDNGNLVVVTTGAISTRSYGYDYANRLVRIDENGSALATYSYDALGRCISKTASPNGLPATTNRYLYDGGRMIESRQGGNIDSYVHRDDDRLAPAGTPFILDGSRSQDDGDIRTFTWRQTSGPFLFTRGGVDYYIHADDQGSAVAITDTNGVCVERYFYDDHGRATFLQGNGLPGGASQSIVGNPFLFHAMQWEPESALYRSENRTMYDASVGRTLSAAGGITDWGTSDWAIFNGVSGVGGSSGNNPWSGPVCSQKNRDQLLEEFKNGDIPNQDDFALRGLQVLNDDRPVAFVDGRYVLRAGVPARGGGGGGGSGGSAGMPCPKIPRVVLKEFFQTGDKPTQAQFASLIDSMLWRSGPRPRPHGHVTVLK